VEYRDDEVTLSRRVGGLRQLPTNLTSWHREKLPHLFGGTNDDGDSRSSSLQVFPKTLQTWTSFLPKSKSIEGWFNRNQALEGTLYGSLGRDQMRNPFEKAKKLYEQCKRPGAKMDPREHFLSGTEMAARLRSMIDYLNHEPMEGEVFHGIPQQKFDAATREHPLYFLPEEQRYLYRRDWRAVQIIKGWARVRHTDAISGERYSLHYIHPERFAGMEGDEVVVYYDRENFENAAQIHSARTGEFICEAQYEERKGSFLENDLSGHDIRKRWKNAVLSIYGTLASRAPSRQLPAEIQKRREVSREGAKEAKPDQPIEVRTIKPPIVPTRRNVFSPPKPEEITKRRSRLEEEAGYARQLRETVEG